MDLVAAVTDENKEIYLKGTLGNNNGVFVLNDICNYLYQYKERGITARSIKIEDIENKMSTEGAEKKQEYINNTISELVIDEESGIAEKNTIENTVTYKKNRSWYPEIYKYQVGTGIDTTNILKEGDIYNLNGDKAITQSDAFYTQPTTNTRLQAENITVKNTYYSVQMKSSYFKDNDSNGKSKYRDIFFENNSSYWVASRYISCYA